MDLNDKIEFINKKTLWNRKLYCYHYEKASCSTERSENTGKSNVSSKWQMKRFEEVPEWLQDNEYLINGYRPPLPSFQVCFWSIFRLHNQSGNIWTHVFASVLFACFGFVHYQNFPESLQDQMLIIFQLTAIVISFGCSAIFHTFLCHSLPVAQFVAKLDYCGVCLQIYGNVVGLAYYCFYCDATTLQYFLMITTIIFLICFTMSLLPVFNRNSFNTIRAFIYFLFGCTSLLPQVSWFHANNWQIDSITRMLIMMDVYYIACLLFYTCKFPEKYFPKKCDFIQSHMWFHIFVMMGTYYSYSVVFELASSKKVFNRC